MSANITQPYAEYKAQCDLIAGMSKELIALKAELVEAKLSSDSIGTTRALTMMIRASLQIVSYAIANLSPEINKRWPFDSLRVIAASMKDLADYSILDEEYARELEKFALECDVWETRRKQTGERYVPPPEAPPTLAELIADSPKQS